MATRRLNNNYAKFKKKGIYIRIQGGRLADRPEAGRPLPLLLLGPNHRPASGLPRRSLRHANIWKPNCKTERGGSGSPQWCPAAPHCLPTLVPLARTSHARNTPARPSHPHTALRTSLISLPVLHTNFTEHYNYVLPES